MNTQTNIHNTHVYMVNNIHFIFNYQFTGRHFVKGYIPDYSFVT